MRNEIIALLARLQQSSSLSSDEQTNHNIREITTDRIFSIFAQALPEEIDIDAKYELNGHPIALTIDTLNRSEEENLEHVTHIARYADDNGWNRFRREYLKKLQEPYNV